MATRYYRAILDPAGDGGYGVVFPEVPGCTSHGQDADHAALMAAEGLAGHLALLARDGDPLPEPAPLDAPLPDWAAEGGPPRYLVLVPVELPAEAVRINISFEKHFAQRVDKAAERRGMSRSAFLAEGARRLMAEA